MDMQIRDNDATFAATRQKLKNVLIPQPGDLTGGVKPDFSSQSASPPSDPVDGIEPLAAQNNTARFSGISDTTANPPDTMGAAGPSRLAEFVNGAVAFFDKGGTKLSQVDIASFFFVPNVLDSYFDPRVLYDQYSGRFIAICANRSSAGGINGYLMLAVSRTSDPTQVWDKWSIPTPRGIDYPTLGVDGNAVYSTTGEVPPGSPQVTKVIIVPKAQLLSGSLSTYFVNTGLPDSVYQPCHTFGSPGAEYLVGRTEQGGVGVKIYKITNPTSAPVLSFVGTVGSSVVEPPDAPQAGGPIKLETIDSRIMNAVCRNGFVWCAQNVGVSGRAAIQWYQINPGGTPTITQSGTITDGTRSYFYPSVAVNAAGDVAFGFSGSSATQYAGTYYTTRKASDPSGFTEVPVAVKAGDAYYARGAGFSPDSTRWGDYSVTCVDPANDTTFWSIQEYAKLGNQWGTWWAAIGPDISPPSIAITSPAHNSYVNILATITGTTQDNANGSGLNRVELFIKRASDSYTWNGTAWVAPPAVAVSPAISGSTWTYSSGPSGANLAAGTYYLSAYSYDNAGNRSTVASATVIVDYTGPSIAFTSPTNGATVTTLATVSGTASDPAGLNRVDLYIKRTSDSAYWTGTTWTTTSTVLRATLSGSTWTYNSGPPGTSLTNGATYSLFAYGYDTLGNRTITSITVTKGAGLFAPEAGEGTSATGAAESSPVALSSGTVNVKEDSVRLFFTGALHPEVAGDAMHYQVWINGEEVEAPGAAYGESTFTVTLALPEGALKSGDSVTVVWSGLLDIQARPVADGNWQRSAP